MLRLLERANLQPEWIVLDISRDGSQIAQALTQQVRQVIAIGEAESLQSRWKELPFRDGQFDLVISRLAIHHSADFFRLMQSWVRALKPGGMMLIQDLVVPEEERAARYVNAFESLMNPKHQQAYTESEWRGVFLDTGLRIEHTEVASAVIHLVEWAEKQGCSDAVIQRLQIMLAQTPPAVREWWQPQYAGTVAASFQQHSILIQGTKKD